MATKPVCLVCKKDMEIGFISEVGYGTVNVPRWTGGTPESSFLTGEVKNTQRKEGLKVVAYRCPECEALRLYAPSAT
jgi:hypothetical protein